MSTDKDTGFIILNRKIMEWEWYDDAAMYKVFTGLIMLANYRDKKWHGQTIKRGSFVTSIQKLQDCFNLSKPTVSRCLKNLESTGEIKSEVIPNKYRIITILNYEQYQDKTVGKKFTNRPTNKPTNNLTDRPTNSLTPTKQYNKGNKETIESPFGEYETFEEMAREMRK